MAVIIPTNKSVESFEGLHLYHGGISNCSMRVRMTLIEKGLGALRADLCAVDTILLGPTTSQREREQIFEFL